MAAFTAVIAFSSATGSDLLEDYAGLARREPVLALVFTFALLSLAGIPPLGGFVGRSTCSPPPWSAGTSGWSSSRR